MKIRFVELEEALHIHRHQIMAYGGSVELRDLGLLESALAMPPAGLGEEYFHKGIFEMAAAYAFYQTKNHPFVDGNKRVAASCADYFLHLNGQDLDADPDAFASLILGLADGSVDKAKAAKLFLAHCKRSRR